jgi:ketosteroid isomerase-like protein
MCTKENVQIAKDFVVAMGRGGKQALLALSAEDIERIIPGENCPLAGMHRGRTGLEAVLRKASNEIGVAYPEPPAFMAQGRSRSCDRRRNRDNQSHE